MNGTPSSVRWELSNFRPPGGEPLVSRFILSRPNLVLAGQFARDLNIPHAVARVLAARGFSTSEEAQSFLNADISRSHDPWLMGGMAEAVDRLSFTIKRQGKIVVFGDYDCDGIGAVAILSSVLKRLGADVRPFIPHRLREGYGLRLETLRRAVEEHRPEGIVTVDCGITSHDPITEAVGQGIYVIVTDHHIPPQELPRDAILLDPKLPGCTYPFKDLAGAGIAWKLSAALLERFGPEAGIPESQRVNWLISLAKLAALSTVADMVPLTGENRLIVSIGLAALKNPKAPGLSALLAISDIPKGRAPRSHEVSFRIAPRLNAAGRLDDAVESLELLLTTDPQRAKELAHRLDAANEKRRALTESVVASVRTRLKDSFDPQRDAIIVEAGSEETGWHRGVLGISAAKLAREFERPVILLAQNGSRFSGSGRTFGRTPLYDRIAPVAGRLAVHFGGHAAAVGLTIESADFNAFASEVHARFRDERDETEWEEEHVIDTELAVDEIDDTLVTALDSFEPHGVRNPPPLFLIRGLEWAGRGSPVGPSGLLFTLTSGERRLNAVGWNLATIPHASRQGTFDAVASLGLDPRHRKARLSVVALHPPGILS